MKDNVEIGRLTKFDYFRLRPLKPYKLFIF